MVDQTRRMPTKEQRKSARDVLLTVESLVRAQNATMFDLAVEQVAQAFADEAAGAPARSARDAQSS